MIGESSNSLAKLTLSTGSETPSSAAPAASSNQLSSFSLQLGGGVLEGDDMTSGAFPGDGFSGQAPGVVELGGIAHFELRTNPTISH